MRFLLALLFLYSSFLTAAPINVSVDRTLIAVNESFEINFSTTEDPDANPDFSPLEKDFEIIHKNHGSKLSWVNGKRSMNIQWTFTVIAKKEGELQIPALRFGSETSPAVSITVNKIKPLPAESYEINAPIFLEVEATPINPYLQSQVIYRLRFFRRVNIVEARLTDPELNDAVVEKLGEDKNYQTERGGMVYAVTERNYAIFPQKSGKMVINPLKLTAAVLMGNSSRMNSLFGTQSTKRERVESKAITLDVRPIPADFTGKHWLVAKNVNLTQQWSGDPQKIQVGEPLTRTLTLMVNGATMSQLPQLQQPLINKGLKNYPDQPNLKENKTPTGVIAFREEKVAFIPSKNGTYTLPEIKIDWFNVETGKMEAALIPETVVTAIGGVAETQTAVITPTAQANVSTPAPVAQTVVSETANAGLWQGLTIFFAMAWLVTLYLLFTKKTNVIDEPKADDKAVSLKACIKTLKHACQADEAQSAKEALLIWGQLTYATTSLGALANHCEARLRDEILNLNQHLYSQETGGWQGKLLFEGFSEHKAREKIRSKTTDDALEPLYRI
ncbi:MAG: BatD family protein [Methylococcales bacterium]|nr:BatD family protein [Methylococcales bacterium]